MSKNPSFKEEELLWDRGMTHIIGIDEVGRGAFCGPLVAAGVILPKHFKINGIRDSKLLSSKKRIVLSEYIKSFATSIYISEVGIDYINEFGIGKANQKAFLDCATNIKQKADFALVDGFGIAGYDQKLQKAIIHGDQISVSIAAASIIAKVYRDNIMIKLHDEFPVYNFLENKGYGTKTHRDAIKKYGLSKMHRTSFDLKKFLIS